VAVDGFGGGIGASADPSQWIEDWMVYFVIGIIAVLGIVGLYIFLKMRKKGMRMSNININIKK